MCDERAREEERVQQRGWQASPRDGKNYFPFREGEGEGEDESLFSHRLHRTSSRMHTCAREQEGKGEKRETKAQRRERKKKKSPLPPYSCTDNMQLTLIITRILIKIKI